MVSRMSQRGETETCLDRIKWTADNVFGGKASFSKGLPCAVHLLQMGNAPVPG